MALINKPQQILILLLIGLKRRLGMVFQALVQRVQVGALVGGRRQAGAELRVVVLAEYIPKLFLLWRPRQRIEFRLIPAIKQPNHPNQIIIVLFYHE